MNRKIVRVGIVGAGFSGSFHFEAIRKVCSVTPEVVGVFAADRAQAAA